MILEGMFVMSFLVSRLFALTTNEGIPDLWISGDLLGIGGKTYLISKQGVGNLQKKPIGRNENCALFLKYIDK